MYPGKLSSRCHTMPRERQGKRLDCLSALLVPGPRREEDFDEEDDDEEEDERRSINSSDSEGEELGCTPRWTSISNPLARRSRWSTKTLNTPCLASVPPPTQLPWSLVPVAAPTRPLPAPVRAQGQAVPVPSLALHPVPAEDAHPLLHWSWRPSSHARRMGLSLFFVVPVLPFQPHTRRWSHLIALRMVFSPLHGASSPFDQSIRLASNTTSSRHTLHSSRLFTTTLPRPSAVRLWISL